MRRRFVHWLPALTCDWLLPDEGPLHKEPISPFSWHDPPCCKLDFPYFASLIINESGPHFVRHLVAIWCRRHYFSVTLCPSLIEPKICRTLARFFMVLVKMSTLARSHRSGVPFWTVTDWIIGLMMFDSVPQYLMKVPFRMAILTFLKFFKIVRRWMWQ